MTTYKKVKRTGDWAELIEVILKMVHFLRML